MYDPMYHDTEWWGSVQHHRLTRDYFTDSPIIVDNEFHNSQTIRDNRLVFGPWAGPQRCITNLIHEMAHLVEIDDARILQHGWGLRMPEQYIPGRYSRMAPTPMTWQSTKREVRVMAMQWLLQNAFGITCTPRDVLNPLKFMADWCNIPHGLEGDYNYRDAEEARYAVLEKELMEYAKGKYTLEFFNQEWVRKNDLLTRVSA